MTFHFCDKFISLSVIFFFLHIFFQMIRLLKFYPCHTGLHSHSPLYQLQPDMHNQFHNFCRILFLYETVHISVTHVFMIHTAAKKS